MNLSLCQAQIYDKLAIAIVIIIIKLKSILIKFVIKEKEKKTKYSAGYLKASQILKGNLI